MESRRLPVELEDAMSKKEIRKPEPACKETVRESVQEEDPVAILRLIHGEIIAVHRELEQFKNRMTR